MIRALNSAKRNALLRLAWPARRLAGDRPSTTTPTQTPTTPSHAVAESCSPTSWWLPSATSSGAQPRMIG
jgi:hypothetical protein